ncbi:MAG TPA: hypothetical protein HPQ00_06785, partial [Magnetococcales bacterium]|nr:hypothetical protein [Magnetococcales bacterium]
TIWFQLESAICEWKGLDKKLRLDHNEKITILHLSDLQFGAARTPHSKLEWQDVKNTITYEWSKGPTFIAITGDITENGLPNEFNQAEEWMKNLVKDWNGWELPNNRLLLVPGNHDALLPLSVADYMEYARTTRKIQWKDSLPDSPSMTAFAFTPFLQFAQAMSGENDWIRPDRQYWIREQFKHLGVIFFGCNTASKFAPQGGVEKGTILENDFLSVSQKLRSLATENTLPDCIVIGLGHHPPFDLSTTNENTCNGYTKLCTMNTPISSKVGYVEYAYVPRILLHGHIHKREFSIHKATSEMSTVSIAASTPSLPDGSRFQDAARGFNMIELLRTDGTFKEMKCWAYEWDQERLEKKKEISFSRNKRGGFTNS